MIKKLERHIRVEKGLTQDIKISCPPEQSEIVSKINELVDAVNAIQKEREAERFEIKEWIGILEAVRKSVNVHEKQIDELQMKVEPEKCETRAENLPDLDIQMSWIGKLCWFWDNQEEYKFVGILGEVADNGTYFQKDGIVSYLNCEPVKPDDDIIYKGE